MEIEHLNIDGLSGPEVRESREKHGTNQLKYKKDNFLTRTLKNIFGEPMVILLLVTAILYLIMGQTGDAIFLAAAIGIISGISFYQDGRSRNALSRLHKITQPHARVIREGSAEEIDRDQVVVGDVIIVEEGTTVPADAKIFHSNDFSVNESILTGESFSIFKDKSTDNNQIYMGTLVSGGLAIAKVSGVGNETTLGRIGKDMEGVVEEKSPLEGQINDFVKKMVIAGGVVFLVVWGINFMMSYDIADSLLQALTLAMSILPEEIPVAFATFMAMGAWRMSKFGVITKEMRTVESLGSATTICVDKTGTITKNEMKLARLYALDDGRTVEPDGELTFAEKELITMGMWASEPIPFDPMEKSLHQSYMQIATADERTLYKMIHEYPLDGKPPMMTHIFENKEGHRIIAAKGGPEALMDVSGLGMTDREKLEEITSDLAQEGYRVLGVGEAKYDGQIWPARQQDFDFEFLGLLAFYDPPKENIAEVFQSFYKAGLDVKIITGDISETTTAIARKTGFHGYDQSLSGMELVKIPPEELSEVAANTQVFTRMYPDAKLKIINTLKENGEVVAMTGDGVNDGPALKAAHIGVAMGQKGTEIAKQAASLILMDDDLSKMVDAIALGRKIYANLKKAIQYIISIHIPIILTVFIPLALGWIYPNIFTPVHVILLELIMGPTCSIVYENEPMEEGMMEGPPRPLTQTFFNSRELMTSVLQGLAITAGTLGVYQIAVSGGGSESVTRTMVFTTLMAANIFLTFVNRSFYYSILTTFRYRNPLVPLIIGITVLITASLLYIPAFNHFFHFDYLTSQQVGISVSIGFLSVIWFEGYKWYRRRKGVSSVVEADINSKLA